MAAERAHYGRNELRSSYNPTCNVDESRRFNTRKLFRPRFGLPTARRQTVYRRRIRVAKRPSAYYYYYYYGVSRVLSSNTTRYRRRFRALPTFPFFVLCPKRTCRPNSERLFDDDDGRALYVHRVRGGGEGENGSVLFARRPLFAGNSLYTCIQRVCVWGVKRNVPQRLPGERGVKYVRRRIASIVVDDTFARVRVGRLKDDGYSLGAYDNNGYRK